MRRSNLFIVGAPKCGTTSLYEYLKRHPDVFFPSIKEPNFFAKDLDIRSYPEIATESDYLALYKGATSESYLGDASQFHLYSKVAAEEIRRWNPESKIIIMLREPSAMIHSLHSQYSRTGDEDIPLLHEALHLGEHRLRGRHIPEQTLFPKCMTYEDVATFSPQVRRFLQTFDRENVLIVLLEDLKKDSRKVYLDILHFLGLSTEYVPPLLRFNVGRKQDEEPISAQLTHHLKSILRDDVQTLSALIERDLSSWN